MVRNWSSRHQSELRFPSLYYLNIQLKFKYSIKKKQGLYFTFLFERYLFEHRINSRLIIFFFQYIRDFMPQFFLIYITSEKLTVCMYCSFVSSCFSLILSYLIMMCFCKVIHETLSKGNSGYSYLNINTQNISQNHQFKPKK